MNKKVELREYRDQVIGILNENFTLSIRPDDYLFSWADEEYNIKTNMFVSLQIHSYDKEESILPLLEILAKTMIEFKGDMLVVADVGTEYLIRKNSKVIVTRNLPTTYLDEYGIEYLIKDRILDDE